MTQFIESEQNTFKFYDELRPNYDEYCNVTIKVDTLLYTETNKYVYHIKFNYECSKNIEHPHYLSNRFYDQFGRDNLYQGDIIAVNEFSERLVKYLLMDFDELGKLCGHGTAQRYKLGLIDTIKNFWD